MQVSTFFEHPLLLNTKPWDKQKEILSSFWNNNYNHAIWALGRRSGKTFMAAGSSVYAAIVLAPLYKKFLRKGENFHIVSVATENKQARIALKTAKDLIKNSPLFSQLIIGEDVDSLHLANGAIIKAIPCSARSARGWACPFLIFDEAGHYLDTGGNSSGDQIYQALAPSVAQFGELGRIVLLSSPWVKAGIFWNKYEDAKNGKLPKCQLIQLPTWEVNPTIHQSFYDEQLQRDPALFQVEYAANFSEALAAFVSNAVVEIAVKGDRYHLEPQAKFKGKYVLSLDPAKGSRDNYVACIAHFDGDKFVVDLWHEFQPKLLVAGIQREIEIEAVEAWILEQHEKYRFKKIVLDQYNSQATIQRLRKKLPIEELTWTSKTHMQAFGKLRQLFSSANIELYNNTKALTQIKGLTLINNPNGTWKVTGGDGAGVDDYCSALAGAVLIADQKGKSMWDSEL